MKKGTTKKEYSLYALNPLLPGLEPGPAPLALAEVCATRLTGPGLAPGTRQGPAPNRPYLTKALGLVLTQIQSSDKVL